MDRARGIGIILVILGHVIVSSTDAGQISASGPWGTVKYFIYSGHMPLFMVLAGLFISKRVEKGPSKFLRSSATTVVWPYVVWGSAILLASALAGDLRNPVALPEPGLSLLWTPIAWMWFLYALFVFHAVSVLARGNPWAMTIFWLFGCVAARLFELGPFFGQLLHFFVLFVLGVILGRSTARDLRNFSALGAALLLVAAMTLASAALAQGWPNWTTATIPAEVLAAFGLCAVSTLPMGSAGPLLQYFGKRSLALYVSHFFFITAMRIVLDSGFGISDFAIVLPACFVAAVAGPLAMLTIATRLGLTTIAGLGFPVGAPPRLGRPKPYRASPHPIARTAALTADE